MGFIPKQPEKLAFGQRESSRDSIAESLAQPKCQVFRLFGYRYLLRCRTGARNEIEVRKGPLKDQRYFKCHFLNSILTRSSSPRIYITRKPTESNMLRRTNHHATSYPHYPYWG